MESQQQMIQQANQVNQPNQLTIDVISQQYGDKRLDVLGSIQEPWFIVNQGMQLTMTQFSDLEIRNLNQHNFNQLKIVNEDGLYEIIFRTNSPLAEQFKKNIRQLIKDFRLGKIQYVKQNAIEFQQKIAIQDQEITDLQDKVEDLELDNELLQDTNEELKQENDTLTNDIESVNENILENNRTFKPLKNSKQVNISIYQQLKDYKNDTILQIFCCNNDTIKQQLIGRLGTSNEKKLEKTHKRILYIDNVANGKNFIDLCVYVLFNLELIQEHKTNTRTMTTKEHQLQIIQTIFNSIYEKRLNYDELDKEDILDEIRDQFF